MSLNYYKIITIINYFAYSKKNITKLEVVKLFYFSEKEHLKLYGRFITGATYKKLRYGPVPSQVLDLINFHDKLENKIKNFLDANISFGKGDNKPIISKSAPDIKYLSRSEIKILKKIVEKYKNYSASQLITATHNESWWKSLKLNDIISLDNFIESFNDELQVEIKKYNDDIKEDIQIINSI